MSVKPKYQPGLNLKLRATALDGRVSTEWSRCPGSMARCPRDGVATATKLSRLDAFEELASEQVP